MFPYLSPELINAILEWFGIPTSENCHAQSEVQHNMMADTATQEDRSAEDRVAGAVSNSILRYGDD